MGEAVTLSWRGTVGGMRVMAPFAVFVVPFAAALGAAAIEKGLTVWEAVAMSALVFAGASQFAALEVWEHPLPHATIALVTLAVNARLVIQGAALARWLNALSWPRRLGSAALITDANFADSYRAFRSGVTDVGRLAGGGLILWLVWVGGTALGGVLGQVMGSLKPWGVDVVMAGFFVSMVVADLRFGGRLLPVVVGAAVAVLTLDVLPAGWNVVAAALAGGAAALFGGSDDRR